MSNKIILLIKLNWDFFCPFTEDERDGDRVLEDDSQGWSITLSYTWSLERKQDSLHTKGGEV